jgi:hypothetical protein
VFRTCGYDPKVCWALTRLCTFQGRLPQGAVTSPRLSNIISIKLDARLLGYARIHRMAYSRYADDLTFSANHPARLVGALKAVRKIVTDEGFSLNERKTRFMGPTRCRRVTGLIKHGDAWGVGRRAERGLRARLDHLIQLPPADASRPVESRKILGVLACWRALDVNRYGRTLEYARRLAQRRGVAWPGELEQLIR